jgi:hypothetical protein
VKPYPEEVEMTMKTFFGSLREVDRRRYAAVEAAELGPGGLAYLSRLLGIDSSTIRQGEADLRDLPDLPPERVRKKGADEKEREARCRTSLKTSGPCSRSTPPAAPSNPG